MQLDSLKTIVFIDDDCIFCNYWGNFILKNDQSNSILISPSNSSIYNELQNKYNLLPNPKETIILLHNNDIFEKSNAVIKIARLMKNWQSFLIIGYIIPRFVRDFIYDVIAKNRKSLMTDSCVIDEIKQKDKYIL
ncbi:MAG: thiol-disulfide oxidoreductase DCC family protein [Parvicellaceae bacterium]|tara:strand:+ start:1382 stop:1786 length:405 start_codon:yes stop_codon:yes gene_type:complete